MNPVVRYVLLSITGTALAAILVITWIGGDRAWHAVVCEELEICVNDNPKDKFVCTDDIAGIIEDNYGPWRGEHAFSLNMDKIESCVNSHSAISHAEAWTTKDGILHISVDQKKPSVRFQSKKYGFYTDKDGQVFPLQEKASADVPMIDGEFPLGIIRDGCPADLSQTEQKWICEAMALCEYIQNDPVWRSRIIQIHSDKNGCYSLVEKGCKETFVFGAAREIPEKFRKLELYHTAVQGKGKEYGSVDLRFDNMLICK